MRTRALSGLLVSAGILSAPGEAVASHTIDFKGYRYTCQTRCEILVRDGAYQVVDARGGEVHRRSLQSTPPPGCNWMWICDG